MTVITDATATRFATHVGDIASNVAQGSQKASADFVASCVQAMSKVTDAQAQVAAASDVEWIAAIFSAQAELSRTITSAYVSTAREFLK